MGIRYSIIEGEREVDRVENLHSAAIIWRERTDARQVFLIEAATSWDTAPKNKELSAQFLWEVLRQGRIRELARSLPRRVTRRDGRKIE